MTRRFSLASVGRALRHRNYRLFFAGQGISLVGTWITRVATSWLVYRLTGSALLLGTVGFAGQIPTFLLAPFAGVIVDRTSRYRVLLVTQVLAMLQSAALAALALSHTITVPLILLLQVVQGIINAFDVPARQSLVIEMVEEREDLPNAIALNSSLVNGARLVGPSVAGLLIAAAGEGWCFSIDAVSYLAVIVSLLAMRLPARPRPGGDTRVLSALAEGFRYAAGFRPVRALLLLVALVSFAGVPYTVLMPVFAAKVLGGGPHALGLLMGASGLGALAGALVLASRSSVLGLGRVLIVTSGAFAVALCVFALSRWMWLSLPFLVVVGAGMMMTTASSNTLLQTMVDEDKRGRVMSFFAMAFFGMAPFGSLAAGWLADRFGAPITVLGFGVATLAGVFVFARNLGDLRQLVRPIYVARGILPR